MNPDYIGRFENFKDKKETSNFRIRDKSNRVFLLTTTANYEIVKRTIELLKTCKIDDIYALTAFLVNLGFESEYKMIINVDFDLNNQEG